MNRTETLIQGKNGLYIFGVCTHCKEPQGIVPSPFMQNTIPDKPMCFCRGANGLSFKIKCCIILNCIKKNGHYCNLIEAREKEYPPGKWNVLVVESLPEKEV